MTHKQDTRGHTNSQPAANRETKREQVNIITYPREAFRRDLRELMRLHTRTVRRKIGTTSSADVWEMLVRDRLPGDEPYLEVRISHTLRHEGKLPQQTAALLLIGAAERRGQAAGLRRAEHGMLEPVDLLRLPGAGMREISLIPGFSQDYPQGETQTTQTPDPERYSRSRGALGAAFDRLGKARLLLIGCGRLGSRLASLLVEGAGAQNLTLIDPDRVQASDPGEMQGVQKEDIRKSKTQALADRLTQTSGSVSVRAFPEYASHPVTLEAAQEADLLFCAVDHDTARVAAAILAVLFHRPLIDAATGVHGTGASRQMGFDVRVTLPGRCLLCLSGLPQAQQAAQNLLSTEESHRFFTNRSWEAERSGSLASLSGLAAHAAVRAAEDLYAGHLQESLWIRGDYLPDGTFSARTHRTDRPERGCALCALGGAGVEGLAGAHTLLRTLQGFRRGGS